MKILLYSPVSLSYGGGVELYFEHLATSLDKQFGDEVQIVCGDVHGQSDRYKEIHYYHFGRLIIPSFKALRVLSAHMRWADVVYFSFGYFGQDILMLVLKWIAKRPVIAAIHAPLFHSDRFHNLAISFVARWTLPCFDGIHILSKQYEHRLRSWGVRKITHAPCGIDPTLFPYGKKKRSNRFTVLFVGRLEYQKGVDLLLEIIPRLPGFQFLIAGDGSLRQQVDHMASLSQHCRYLRVVSYAKVPALYRKADVLLFPSREETSPAVLFEAMACGIPVLARHTPENREILGANGWYVKGDVNAWIDALQVVFKLKTKAPLVWEQRRKALRMRATRFDFDFITKKLRHNLLRIIY